MSVLDILINYHIAFFKGLAVTLQLSAIIWSCGIIIGAALGWAGAHWQKSVGYPTRGVSFFLSGVPILVFLFWLHYPAQAMFNIVVDPFYTAAFTLSIIDRKSVV